MSPFIKKTASPRNNSVPLITSQDVEYAIYIHHPANDDRFGSWERASTTRNRKDALREAQKLYKSRKYAKVEIIRNMFDRTLKRRQGETMMILSDEPAQKTFRTGMHTVLYLAMILLAAALALSIMTAL
ncbi:MAG: hypothetical protein KDI90_02930 [Alphaproteobacteria bacterium]|nr:hypothetical protein [Alphaproteobacteria bacterium]MCB9975301.1 hypothetical protein [Rhodospirillales bacterium]